MVYIDEYKDRTGVDFLNEAGLQVVQISQV
jgi:hypothetical protein